MDDNSQTVAPGGAGGACLAGLDTGGGGLLDSSPRRKLRSVVKGSLSSWGAVTLGAPREPPEAEVGKARDVTLVRKLSGS